MMKGGRPTPLALRIIKGEQASKIRKKLAEQPRVIPAIPEPPAELSPDAIAEWNRVAPGLCACGILTDFDRVALSTYCQHWGRWIEAERDWKAAQADGEKSIVPTATGMPSPNPRIKICSDASRDLMRCAIELGMTPSARSRIKATEVPRADADPASRYFA